MYAKILGMFICPNEHDISFIQLIGTKTKRLHKGPILPFYFVYNRIEAFLKKNGTEFATWQQIVKLIRLMECQLFVVRVNNRDLMFPSLLPVGVFSYVLVFF